MSKILIIDDDHMMSKALAHLIRSTGNEAELVPTLREARTIVNEQPFDVVLLDVQLPDGSGLGTVQEIKESPSRPEVIIITAAGDSDGAELALRCGAWDYIEKSASIKDLLLPLSRALDYRREKRAAKPPLVLQRDRILGNGPTIQECLQKVAQAASCDVNVLITGETGTGKELFARAIHENSARTSHNFVVVDCAALPSELVESLLFGHRKGAFTGANTDQVGLVSQADGGTLFLDEVGELPSEMQKKFLRVLQERCFRPVGAREEIVSRFRVIAATNRNLDVMVEDGSFRNDLLYRLRVLEIQLPPLRRRKEDIVDLVRFHVARLCDLYGAQSKGLSPDFLDALISYGWPGNVRELVNVLDSAVATSGKSMTLFANHLPVELRVSILKESFVRKPGGIAQSSMFEPPVDLPSMRDFRENVERDYLAQLIAQSMNDIQEATRISGISKSRLYELFAKHRLSFTKGPFGDASF
jgi:two-component system NtrC family response regulator